MAQSEVAINVEENKGLVPNTLLFIKLPEGLSRNFRTGLLKELLCAAD